MTPAADLRVWTDLWLSLLVGTTVLVVIAEAASRWVRTAAWQRAVWQMCVVSMAAWLIVEMTGAGWGTLRWVRARVEPAVDFAVASARNPVVGSIVERRTGIAGESISRGESVEAGIWAGTDFLGPRPMGNPLAPEGIGETGHTWMVYGIVVLWLVGTVLVLARVLVGQLTILAFRWRNGSILDKGQVCGLQPLADRLGLRRLRVLAADSLSGPIAFGVLWPTIGLPRRFLDEFRPEAREVILAHELAHLAARDPGWHLLSDLVAAALWWQPLAWWARAQFRLSSEYAADEACAMLRDGPGTLAECLVTLGRRLLTRSSTAWLGIEGNALRSGLAKRVTRLLAMNASCVPPPGGRSLLFCKSFGPAAMVAVALISTSWLRPLVTEKGETMNRIFQDSWRQSLVAMVLVGALGSADRVIGDDDRKETAKEETVGEETVEEDAGRPLVTAASEVGGRKGDTQERKERKERSSKQGRQAVEAEGELPLVRAKLAEFLRDAEQGQVDAERQQMSAEFAEMQARLRMLEAENARLRARIGQSQAYDYQKSGTIRRKAATHDEALQPQLKAGAERKYNSYHDLVDAYVGNPRSGASLEKVLATLNKLQQDLNAVQEEVQELQRSLKRPSPESEGGRR